MKDFSVEFRTITGAWTWTSAISTEKNRDGTVTVLVDLNRQKFAELSREDQIAELQACIRSAYFIMLGREIGEKENE